jgi:hypothetical protein
MMYLHVCTHHIQRCKHTVFNHFPFGLTRLSLSYSHLNDHHRRRRHHSLYHRTHALGEIDKSFSLTRKRTNVRSLILYSYLIPILLRFFPFARAKELVCVCVYTNGEMNDLQLLPLLHSLLLAFLLMYVKRTRYHYADNFKLSYSCPSLNVSCMKTVNRRPSLTHLDRPTDV